MNKSTVRDYLQRAGMEQAQSEAISNILSELVTKADLKAELAHLKAELERLKAELTWRMTALIVFLATVMTLIDLFVD